MATVLGGGGRVRSNERFFLIMAIVMMAVVFSGFSFNLAMGRSTFARPLIVHAHAVTFMGWMVLYVVQNLLVTRGSMALHRTLGWIGAVWPAAMIVLGTTVTVLMAQGGRIPFFFYPAQFLIFDPLLVLTFAGLTWAAVAMRRRTEWHRRLHYCAMAFLTIPAISRLSPAPLLVPFAFEAAAAAALLFPAVGMLVEMRRTGRVHPAWWWGVGVMIGAVVLIELLTYSPVGPAIYHAVTAGTPGAAVPPLAFGAFPPAP